MTMADEALRADNVRRARVDQVLDALLPMRGVRPAALGAAMRWAVEGGGKRIRPLVCLAAAEAVGAYWEDALLPACAIELLHSYTLVHDDLPSMDNDRERRGKPSVWAQFGETNAILAGDALQALAFSVASRTPRNAAAVVAELGARAFGVVAGQVEDVAGAQREDENDISFIYSHKTADLFMAAAAMGAWAGGGSEGDVEKLRHYALHLGLAFQYVDDLLDGDAVLARAETARRAEQETLDALAALANLPGDISRLASLAQRLAARSA